MTRREHLLAALKTWSLRVVSFHLAFGLIFMLMSPTAMLLVFLFPPAVLIFFEFWLMGIPELYEHFPFIVFPSAIGLLGFCATFIGLRLLKVNWHIAMVLALFSGMVVFAFAGNHHVAQIQREEALRLGATCVTGGPFFRDMGVSQIDDRPTYAYGSAVIDGETYLWSYRQMTYADVYKGGPFKDCRPVS